MFEKMDADALGFISFEEFLTYFYKKHRSWIRSGAELVTEKAGRDRLEGLAEFQAEIYDTRSKTRCLKGIRKRCDAAIKKLETSSAQPARPVFSFGGQGGRNSASKQQQRKSKPVVQLTP